MQSSAKRGRLMPVKDGYLMCPHCLESRLKRRLLKINPDTTASRAVAYCRDCKKEYIVDIEQGQCFESRSQ